MEEVGKRDLRCIRHVRSGCDEHFLLHPSRFQNETVVEAFAAYGRRFYTLIIDGFALSDEETAPQLVSGLSRALRNVFRIKRFGVDECSVWNAQLVELIISLLRRNVCETIRFVDCTALPRELYVALAETKSLRKVSFQDTPVPTVEEMPVLSCEVSWAPSSNFLFF